MFGAIDVVAAICRPLVGLADIGQLADVSIKTIYESEGWHEVWVMQGSCYLRHPELDSGSPVGNQYVGLRIKSVMMVFIGFVHDRSLRGGKFILGGQNVSKRTSGTLV